MDHIDSPEPLDKLASAFQSCSDGIKKSFPDRDRDEQVAPFLQRFVAIGFKALQSESDAEIATRWQGTVVKLWDSSLKGKYPFNPKSREDVSMTNFSHMFNPVDGVIWNVDKRLRSVESVKFHDGRTLVSLSNEYKLTINKARAIRDAMFDSEKDSLVKVKFSVKLTQVGLLVGSLLEIGTDKDGKYNELPWNKYPNQTRDFTWEQFNTGQSRMGARVTAYYTEAKRKLPVKDLRDKQWGLLRLLHPPYGTFSEDNSGDVPTYRCVWEFKSPDSQYFYLQAEITPQKKQNPFNQDIFTEFQMTGKVSK
jgi:type VI protein secretion system component VasK